MTGMRSTSIRKKFLVDFLQSDVRLELPPRNRVRDKNFPLWCALKGIPRYIKKQGREMEAIHSGMARYPFLAWNQAGYALAERIAKNKSLTWLQHYYLMGWIAYRYRGWYRDQPSDFFYVNGISTDRQKRAAYAVFDYLNEALRQCDMLGSPLPLRTIISDEFGCFIRILFIDFYLRGKHESPKNNARAA